MTPMAQRQSCRSCLGCGFKFKFDGVTKRTCLLCGGRGWEPIGFPVGGGQP